LRTECWSKQRGRIRTIEKNNSENVHNFHYSSNVIMTIRLKGMSWLEHSHVGGENRIKYFIRKSEGKSYLGRRRNKLEDRTQCYNLYVLN
jgi:hypothetical protein